MLVFNAKKSATFSFVLYVFYVLLPIVPVFLPSIVRYIVLGLILLLSLTAIILKKTSGGSYQLLLTIGIPFLLILQWLGQYSAIYNSFVSYFINIFLFWIPLLISMEFENEDSFESKNFVLLISTLITITLITTIIGNAQYPEVSRLLAGAASSEDSVFFSRLNIGGYKFVYGSVLLLPFWMYVIKIDKRIIPRIMYISAFALTVYSLLITQYSLAIIIALLEIFLVILFKGNNKARTVLMGVLALMLFIVLRPFISEWIQALASSLSGQGYNQVADRLHSIVLMINGNSAEGSTASRLLLYQISWESFLKNPIIGNVLGDRPIGGHSDLIDLLASSGLFGVSLLMTIMWPLIKRIKEIRLDPIFSYSLASAIGFIVVFCFGTVFSSSNIGFSLFLAATLFRQYKNKESYKQAIHCQSRADEKQTNTL